MTQTSVKLTFEDYLAYSDDDNRYEFVNGELVLMAPLRSEHADIIDFLQDALKAEIKRLKLDWVVRPGNVGVRTSETKSRLPDLVVITEAQRLALRNVCAVLQSPPPLVVEIVSNSTKTVDYRAKRAEYAVLDIPEYWIVDPLEDKVTVLLLVEGLYEETVFRGDEQIISQTFPELTLMTETNINSLSSEK
jgi:Uma2 family endonuclease